MGRERERSDVVVVKLNALAVLRQRGRMLERKWQDVDASYHGVYSSRKSGSRCEMLMEGKRVNNIIEVERRCS